MRSPALLVLALCGCHGSVPPAYRVVTGGRPDHGAALIASYGCGACHEIPGVHAAHGEVGPSLSAFARRTFIAGRLPNKPSNVIAWLRDPRAIDHETAMPTLGLGDEEARDVAAYLYTLE